MLIDAKGNWAANVGRVPRYGRMVSALPLNKVGPGVQLESAHFLQDARLCYLADPDGNVIGTGPIVVHRMVSAR